MVSDRSSRCRHPIGSVCYLLDDDGWMRNWIKAYRLQVCRSISNSAVIQGVVIRILPRVLVLSNCLHKCAHAPWIAKIDVLISAEARFLGQIRNIAVHVIAVLSGRVDLD